MSGTPITLIQRQVGLTTAPCSSWSESGVAVVVRIVQPNRGSLSAAVFRRGFLSDFSLSHQWDYLDGFALP